MKIQYCSDLHLEFWLNKNWIYTDYLIPEGDILIIAGDTFYLGKDFGKLEILDKWSQEFKEVFIIPGNHEYYGGYNVATALEKTEEKLRHNVRLVNNKTIVIDGVSFIFTTLWTKIEKNKDAILRGLNDFYKIKFDGQTLNINQYNLLHETSLAFIKNELNKTKENKTVITTHHLPSEFCNIEEFKGSTLNEAFCIDLTDFIEKSNIDYWIYGHSHRNKVDFSIGKTKLVTNQLGYVANGEQFSFDRKKLFEIQTLNK